MSALERHRPRRSSSLKKSNSFKIKRMGNIIVCDCCGQGHQLGRNHLYDYPDNIDDELLCGICLQPLVDPVDTPCSHTYCFICLKSHLRMQKTCPADRQTIKERDIKPSSILVRKILDKLTVVCPNNAYCDQTMTRSSLEVHLKYHCPGSYVTCPREELGCSYMGPRCQLEEHLWSCNYGNDIDRKTGMKIPIIEGRQTTIEIPKGTSDLGLSISWTDNESGFIVEDVFVEGNAYRDGRLNIGDHILAIDGEDFTQKTLAQTSLALCAPVPLMRLTVIRESLEDVSPDTELIELVRRVGYPLGIHIRSSRTRPGIFVYHLVAGSIAEESGLILVGDRLLEVNGCDIRYASVDDAVAVMSQVSGSLKLLISHRSNHPLSGPSELSSHSDSTHPSPIYDEIMAPTGYRVGEPKCVIIRKQPDESFGMNVAGGLNDQIGDLPVYISALRPDSVIGRCDKIQKGDILLRINGIYLSSKTHAEAIQIIKSVMAASTVKMELLQGEDTEENGGLSPDWAKWMKRYESGHQSPIEFIVTLHRAHQESLGFSIVGGVNSPRGDSPIYVRSISPKGLAAQEGRLQPGDRILQINHIEVSSLSQSEVVQVIRNTTGTVTITVTRDSSL